MLYHDDMTAIDDLEAAARRLIEEHAIDLESLFDNPEALEDLTGPDLALISAVWRELDNRRPRRVTLSQPPIYF